MGAVFLCAIARIANEHTDRNTTAYFQNWIEKLEEDNNNRLIAHAAANAQRAVDLIFGSTFEEEKETTFFISRLAPNDVILWWAPAASDTDLGSHKLSVPLDDPLSESPILLSTPASASARRNFIVASHSASIRAATAMRCSLLSGK
jgi:hypothetical protein